MYNGVRQALFTQAFILTLILCGMMKLPSYGFYLIMML